MIPSRLDKYLSDATSLSRSQIRKAWGRGEILVRVAGEARAQLFELDHLVFDGDEVSLAGEVVTRSIPSCYRAFCKPAGVLSSVRAEGASRCLAPWLEELGPGVFPVGRLDRETSGLMLLTDDGNLSHVLTHPQTRIEYHYEVLLSKRPADIANLLEKMQRGVRLSPDTVVQCHEAICSSDAPFTLTLRLEESRSRQLRSMCNVLELDVDGLTRAAIGPVSLGALEPGEMRALTDEEVQTLWSICGGKERVAERRVAALVRFARRHRDEGEPHARLEAWLEANDISIQDSTDDA